MCLYPKLIKNRKYIPNKKNRGVIPPINDERVLLVPVGCGKCIECKKQKSREWNVRLNEEIRHDKQGKFITFTFSNESIYKLSKEITGLDGYNLDNQIAKLAVRRFLERWRKKYKKSVKHWLVTEIGGTNSENIHIHGIIWTDKESKEIDKIWNYGFTWIGDKNNGGYVNEKTINYIVKYMHKTDEKHKEYKGIILTSAGIGKKYVDRIDSKNNKYKENETNETYRNKQGYKMSLPIYYRNKIYNEEEKEKLWLEKLDKNERWVMGVKINVEKNEDEYYKVLYEKRELNKRLGYGNDEKNWELKRYEHNRRNLKIKERINKGKNNTHK